MDAVGWICIWAELCERQGCRKVAVLLYEFAYDLLQKEEHQLQSMTPELQQKERSKLLSAIQRLSLLPSEDYVPLAEWRAELSETTSKRRSVDHCDPLRAVLDFDVPEFDVDADPEEVLRRSSPPILPERKVSNIWVDLKYPPFFQEDFINIDNELAQLPLSQQFIQQGHFGLKIFSFFSKYSFQRHDSQQTSRQRNLTVAVDRPATLQVVNTAETDVASMYDLFDTSQGRRVDPVSSNTCSLDAESGWFYAELMNCAALSHPSLSKSKLLSSSLLRSHGQPASGNTWSATSYSSTMQLAMELMEDEYCPSALLELLQERFGAGSVNTLMSYLRHVDDFTSQAVDGLTNILLQRLHMLNQELPSATTLYYSPSQFKTLEDFERWRTQEKQRIIEALAERQTILRVPIDAKRPKMYTYYEQVVFMALPKETSVVPKQDEMRINFTPSDFTKFAESALKISDTEDFFGHRVVIRALDIIMLAEGRSERTVEHRFRIVLPICNELSLRHGVSSSFVHVLLATLLATRFDHSLSYIRLTAHVLQTLASLAENKEPFTLQELEHLRSVFDLFSGHVNNCLIQMRHLFPKQYRHKAVGGLIAILSSVLRLQSLIETGNSTAHADNSISAIIERCLRASVGKAYLSITEGVMDVTTSVSAEQRLDAMLSPRQLMMVFSDVLSEVELYRTIIETCFHPHFNDISVVVDDFFTLITRDVERSLQAVLAGKASFRSKQSNSPKPERKKGSSKRPILDMMSSPVATVFDPDIFSLMHQMLLTSKAWKPLSARLTDEWQLTFLPFLSTFLNHMDTRVDEWIATAVREDKWSPIFLAEDVSETSTPSAAPRAMSLDPSTLRPKKQLLSEQMLSVQVEEDERQESGNSIASTVTNPGSLPNSSTNLLSRFLSPRNKRLVTEGSYTDLDISPAAQRRSPMYRNSSINSPNNSNPSLSNNLSPASSDSSVNLVKREPEKIPIQRTRVWLNASSSLVDAIVLLSLVLKSLQRLSDGLSMIGVSPQLSAANSRSSTPLPRLNSDGRDPLRRRASPIPHSSELHNATNDDPIQEGMLSQTVHRSIPRIMLSTCNRYVEQLSRLNDPAIPPNYIVLLRKLENISPNEISPAWVSEVRRTTQVGTPLQLDGIDHALLAQLCLRCGDLEAFSHLAQELVRLQSSQGADINALKQEIKQLFQVAVNRQHHLIAIYLGSLARQLFLMLNALRLPNKTVHERLLPLIHLLNGGLSCAALYLEEATMLAITTALWVHIVAAFDEALSVPPPTEERAHALLSYFDVLLDYFAEQNVPKKFLMVLSNEVMFKILLNTLNVDGLSSLAKAMQPWQSAEPAFDIGLHLSDVTDLLNKRRGRRWSLIPF